MGPGMGGIGCRARTTGPRLPPSAHGRPSTVRRPAVIETSWSLLVVAMLALQLAMLASLPSASSSSSKEEDDVR